jgi:hypothetical protein
MFLCAENQMDTFAQTYFQKNLIIGIPFCKLLRKSFTADGHLNESGTISFPGSLALA